MSLKEWVYHTFCVNEGLWKSIKLYSKYSEKRINIDDTQLIITHMGNMIWKSHPDKLKVESVDIPERIVIPIAKDSITEITREPAKDVARYSKGIEHIELHISSQSVTIRMIEKRDPKSIRGVSGNERGFRRYYASRRGIPVPSLSSHSSQKGSGMGLALYSAIATRVRVFRRLYVSSDGGEKCHISLSLPIERNQNG